MIRLPPDLRTRIADEARAAFPRECCGLLEGVRGGVREGGGHIAALHPARNLAAAADRFLIDPADQFAAMRAARAAGRAIIGCYHSHPDGAAVPSAHDRAGAGAEDFLWLIAATDGTACDLAAFVWRKGAFVSIGGV